MDFQLLSKKVLAGSDGNNWGTAKSGQNRCDQSAAKIGEFQILRFASDWSSIHDRAEERPLAVLDA